MINTIKYLLSLPLFYIYVFFSFIVTVCSNEASLGKDILPTAAVMSYILIALVGFISLVTTYCFLLKKFRERFVEASISAWDIFVINMAFILKFILPAVGLAVLYVIAALVVLGTEGIKGNQYYMLPLLVVIFLVATCGWIASVYQGSTKNLFSNTIKVIKKDWIVALAVTLAILFFATLGELKNSIIPYRPLSPVYLINLILVFLTALSSCIGFIWILESIKANGTLEKKSASPAVEEEKESDEL